jgi:hypothetical protein
VVYPWAPVFTTSSLGNMTHIEYKLHLSLLLILRRSWTGYDYISLNLLCSLFPLLPSMIIGNPWSKAVIFLLYVSLLNMCIHWGLFMIGHMQDLKGYVEWLFREDWSHCFQIGACGMYLLAIVSWRDSEMQKIIRAID